MFVKDIFEDEICKFLIDEHFNINFKLQLSKMLPFPKRIPSFPLVDLYYK
jgi:hypothetical protein